MDIDRTVAEPGLRQFLTRFFAWGAGPSVDGYADLFHPDGSLLDAGMDEPLRGDAIRTSMARTLGLIPDFAFAPRRVVGEGHTVFVEATNGATLEGRALRWDAVYCITERDGRVLAGRRYYDQAELYAPLRPGQVHPLADPGRSAPEPSPTPTGVPAGAPPGRTGRSRRPGSRRPGTGLARRRRRRPAGALAGQRRAPGRRRSRLRHHRDGNVRRRALPPPPGRRTTPPLRPAPSVTTSSPWVRC